jgi:predicted nucleic acid-binding protein
LRGSQGERHEWGNISLQEIFDLQLLATMLSNNITRLYTYNQQDFSKFKEIEALIP